MNAQEFQDKYVAGGDWGDCYPVADEELTLMHEEDDVEHKTCYLTKVYRLVDDYFEVTWTRDNSGYWGDGERYGGETRKVVPVKKVVEITTWESA